MLRELLSAVGIIRPVELAELRVGSEEPVLRPRQVTDRLQPAAVPPLLADPAGELSALYGLVPLADTQTAQAMALLVGDTLQRLADRLGGRSAIGALGGMGPEASAASRSRSRSGSPGRSGAAAGSISA